MYRYNPLLADLKERARRKWQGIPLDGEKASRSPWEAMAKAAKKSSSSTLKSRAKEQFQQKLVEVKTWRQKQAEKKAAARAVAEKEMSKAASTISKNEAAKQAARSYAAQLMAEQKAEHPKAKVRRLVEERFKRVCATCWPKFGIDEEDVLPALIGEKCDHCKKVFRGHLKPGKLGPVVDRGADHKPPFTLAPEPAKRPAEAPVGAPKEGVCPSCVEKFGLQEAPSMVAGSVCRFCGSRKNPSLVILSNPERVPGEAAARKAWAHFHLASGRDAKVTSIPDAAGLPKTVVVLGACEGFEWQWNTGDHGGKAFKFRRDMSKGPWLVTDIKAKRLWIVAKWADDLTKLPKDGYFKAIYYYPPSNSGKHDRVRGYRHEFGEGGRLPEHRWFEVYPKLVRRGSRAIEMVPVGTPFRITERGIVG